MRRLPVSVVLLLLLGGACRAEPPAGEPPAPAPASRAPAPAGDPGAAADPRPSPPAGPPGSASGLADAVPIPSPAPTRVQAPGAVVAFGDVHGDLQATRAALRLAGAIDGEDRWVGGDLTVVQTGDQLDRGDDEPEILLLFDRLAAEARAAGGAVYVLNGNHELMNVAGDLRYVTEDGFRDFASLAPADPDPALATLPPKARGRAAAFRPGGPWARRLAARNVVMIVGDTVFVHGGVLPEHVRAGLDRLNQDARAWIGGESPDGSGVLARIMAPNSPVWTRTYSMDRDPRACEVLDQTLRALGARRMVVGHTVQKTGITSACDGKVWRVDVGLADYYGGPVEVLRLTQSGVEVLREGEPTRADASRP